MTGETLRDCPFCGGKVDSDMIGAWVTCSECIEPDGDVQRDKWNTRALAPTLDRVLEAIENDERDHFEYTTPARNGNDYVWRAGKEHILGVLHALRAEQSADAGGESGGES